MNSNPRKIVLILGNGFDLDLGLKTSYKDFWASEFCPKDYPAPLIKHLNQKWKKGNAEVRWYDLENELLSYYTSHSGPDGVHTYPDVVSADLLKYIRSFDAYRYSCESFSGVDEQMERLVRLGYAEYGRTKQWAQIKYLDDFKQSTLWRDHKSFCMIKNGLCKYLSSLDHAHFDNVSTASHLLLALSKSAEAGDSIEIFTFNYTPVLFRGHSLKGISVHHMHGSCEDGNIIIGTRDDLQMEKGYDFLMKSMDDSFNPPDIVTSLKEADEVIIFGHSLGENDRQYFAPFFLKQADVNNPDRNDITIFTYDDNAKLEIKRALLSMTNGNLAALYSINQPRIIRTNNIKEDNKLMYNFLINHHTDEHYAEEVVGKLSLH